MSKKKNIDRLFQEKFTDFNPQPDEKVWARIESALDAKKKRGYVIPFWWRLGGAAAAIALIFTLTYNYYYTPEIADDLPVVSDENNTKPEKKTSIKNDLIIEPEKRLSDTGEASQKNNVKEEKNGNQDKFQSIKKNTLASDVIIGTPKNSKKDGIASNDNIERKSNKDNVIKESSDRIASTTAENNKKTSTTKNSTTADKNLIDTKKPIESNTKVAAGESKKDEDIDEGKKSIFDVIEAQNKEKEALAIVKNPEEKWSVNPVVAPVLFSTLSNGSPIDSQFADNSKTGNVSLSYGINVNYKVSKKLSIRSGVNRVNYSYSTNNVGLTTAAAAAKPIETIAFNARSSNLGINDLQNRTLPASPIISSRASSLTPEINSILNQEFGYIEVPLEVKYRLLDKKLGINVIGGVSSLFLTNNSISVESSGFSSDLGEATNLNSTNFSTNLGVGFDYKISKKIQVNFEPVFKYQLNTFSGANNGFRPYTLGIYTGFNVKF